MQHDAQHDFEDAPVLERLYERAVPEMYALRVQYWESQHLNSFSKRITQWAQLKGFHDRPAWADVLKKNLVADPRHDVVMAAIQMNEQPFPAKPEQIALMHSELSELLEGIRKPGPDDHVPELTFEEAECADLMIRMFHYCGRHGIDLGRAIMLKHAYNLSRPYKHGKAF